MMFLCPISLPPKNQRNQLLISLPLNFLQICSGRVIECTWLFFAWHLRGPKSIQHSAGSSSRPYCQVLFDTMSSLENWTVFISMDSKGDSELVWASFGCPPTLAISAAIYRGAKCPTLKTAEKQPKRVPSGSR